MMPFWARIRNQGILLFSAVLLVCFSVSGLAASASPHPMVGTWKINEELSDDTDEQVEAAIIRGGGKVQRKWFGRKEKERYRGGPEEQELYDRISYDAVLRIDYDDPEFWFGYADGYQRVFHSDGRKRVVGANDLYANGSKDFSFADWEGETLIVEARPRDGGFTMETYTLQADNTQLRVEMQLKPFSFGSTVRLVRVYDRQPD